MPDLDGLPVLIQDIRDRLAPTPYTELAPGRFKDFWKD